MNMFERELPDVPQALETYSFCRSMPLPGLSWSAPLKSGPPLCLAFEPLEN